MSYFENFLNANKAYVDLHGTAHLPLKPKTKVAIVTCMDSRLHVAQALGLALGDAHILRNAGGRVTEDIDSFFGHFSTTDGDTRNRSSSPYRLWCSDL